MNQLPDPNARWPSTGAKETGKSTPRRGQRVAMLQITTHHEECVANTNESRDIILIQRVMLIAEEFAHEHDGH